MLSPKRDCVTPVAARQLLELPVLALVRRASLSQYACLTILFLGPSSCTLYIFHASKHIYNVCTIGLLEP